MTFEDGGFVENVPVLKHVWDDIVFPEDKDELGSCVLWNNIANSNIIAIVGVILKNDEVESRDENQFLIKRSFTQSKKGKTISNHLSISGNAKAGKLNITVDGGEDSGELAINVFNKKKTGKLNINLKGNINLDSSDTINLNIANKISFSVDDKKTNFSYEKEKGFIYKDEFNNELIFDKEKMQLNAKKKILLGKGKEPITLGDQMKSMLDEFITQVASSTVVTALGTMPLVNASLITQLQLKTKKILSKYSFSD